MKAKVIKTVNLSDKANAMLLDIVQARNDINLRQTNKKDVVESAIDSLFRKECKK